MGGRDGQNVKGGSGRQLTEKRNEHVVDRGDDYNRVGKFCALEYIECRDKHNEERTFGAGEDSCRGARDEDELNRVLAKTLMKRSMSRLSKMGDPSPTSSSSILLIMSWAVKGHKFAGTAKVEDERD
jgi:hypothetical protein